MMCKLRKSSEEMMIELMGGSTMTNILNVCEKSYFFPIFPCVVWSMKNDVKAEKEIHRYVQYKIYIMVYGYELWGRSFLFLGIFYTEITVAMFPFKL
jgi:hypothetical protein